MDITIGIDHINRELAFETQQSAEQLQAAFAEAVAANGALTLTDAKGRVTLIPATKIAYLSFGGEETRKVGFGTL